jgi:YD repeat-containing protein
MRYLYPLALLLALASCQDEEKKETIDRKKTDWAFYKLEGNVKSVSERSYDAASGQKGATKHDIASKHDTDLTFNEKGLLILEKQWINGTTLFEESKFTGRENLVSKIQYINGSPGIKTEYSRDKAGNVTGIIRRNGDNTQLDRIGMIYNGKKLAEKRSFGNQDHPNDKTTYTYDRKGNLKGESMYLNTEYIQVKNLYEYDDQNRKIAETRYSKDKLIYKTTFGYDGQNLIKKETTGPTGAIEYREKRSYDKKGNLLEKYVIDSNDKSMTHEAYKYDAQGNMTEWISTVNNIPEMQMSYKYDSHNNITAMKTKNGKGETIDDRTYTYEYDNNGNWIKKTVSVNGDLFTIAERKIEYFADEE